MNWLIRKFAPFLGMRFAMIDAALSGVSEPTKKILLGRILAKHYPTAHLHGNPKKKPQQKVTPEQMREVLNN